jgi:hypothetical protein
MSAKKKPLTKQESNKRYLERKKAKAIAAAFESALESGQAEEATEQTIKSQDNQDFIDADDFNEFAPNQGIGDDFIDHVDGGFRDIQGDEVVSEKLTPVEPQEAAPLPHHVAPKATPEAPAVVVPNLPASSPEVITDAVIIERLINGINYLYPFARLTKGIRGPDIHKVEIIKKNILLARELIKRLE